jgi:DNA-binding response OmpR family regulator
MFSCTRPRVLIIDGNPEELSTLTVKIQQQRWLVTQANRGRRGVQLALASLFDIILLETHLPDMDGFAICRQLRESVAANKVPIMFLSHAGNVQSRLQGLNCGGVDYLVKPCDPEEVLARMLIHLKRVQNIAAPVSESHEPKASYEKIIFDATVRYIRENLAKAMMLHDIAQRAGIYEKKLTKIFHRHAGITVFAWIREERFRRSMELLSNSSLAVQDVAEEVGFCNASNFIRAFHDRTGCTPKQFQIAAVQPQSARYSESEAIF